jgi:hypothetical protein
MPATALCVAGSTPATTPTTDYSTTWGGGISITLDQDVYTSSATPATHPVAIHGSGVSYTFSTLPVQVVRLTIDDNGTQYCATLTGRTGVALWSSFNTKCWDGTGTALTGAPTATTLNIQVVAPSTTAESFGFCVTSIGFAG